MTKEMGPRDVDLGLKERFAAQFLRVWAWAISRFADDSSVRFEPSTATLSLSGESDDSQNKYARGRFASTFVSLNEIAMLTVLGYCMFGMGYLAGSPSVISALVLVVVSLLATISLWGSAGITSEIDVVDHTTEPAPDAVDELKERYVDGEIDTDDLEREAAEVWDR